MTDETVKIATVRFFGRGQWRGRETLPQRRAGFVDTTYQGERTQRK